MALSPDLIPLPCSLRERVRARHAPQDAPLSSDSLSHDELVSFLARTADSDHSPLATIQRCAAEAGRNASLHPDDHATVTWITQAFENWQREYPLESPLQDQLRRLLPLAVAVALRDDSFFTPGSHPLHRLLDSLQSGSAGWQARLDRAGQMLEQRVERSVEKALEWLNGHGTDITAIDRELEAANERDAARAQRMVQRLAETEEARLKTLGARREAAQAINALLADFELPSAIGEFLKGPWYDSAQLVLVKHGDASREWTEMLRATRHLMESVQPPVEHDEVERDRRAQILRHLPGELRRWLLSLEHDSEATDSAIGLVEYAHLRLQHGQLLQLTRVPPLPVEQAEAHVEDDGETITSGQWYQFSDEDGALRAQLVLQLEKGQHLLFTNFVGLKALDLSQRAFRQRLHDGFARLLPNQSTFSISLAGAAGIDSDDALRALVDPGHPPPAEAPPSAQATDQRPDTPEGSDYVDPTPARTEETFTDNAQDGSEQAPEPAAPPREAREEPEAAAASPEAWQQGNTETPASEAWETPDGEASPREAWEAPADDPPHEAAPTEAEASDDRLTEFAPADEMEPEAPLDIEDPESTVDAEDTPAEAAPETPAPADQPPPATAAPDWQQPAPAQPAPSQSAPSQPPAPSPEPAPVTPQQPAAPQQPEPPPQPTPPPAPAQEPAPAAPQQPAAPEQPEPPPQPTPQPVAPPPSAPPQPSAVPPQQPPAPPQQPPPVPQQPPPPQAVPPGAVPPPPQQPPPSQAVPPGAPPPPQQQPPPPPSWQPPPVNPPSTPERLIEVPMGAWLGFHDGETPIMAKLAVYDPRRDNYIFVNRKGIALRELNRSELVTLMDQGLVDILETRSYFRDEVQRARGEEP